MIQKNWQELIKPTKLDIIPGHDESREARVVAEPLERGFGLTLGNALRRVLLSSIQGAAVTAVQIDGVLHEFSSIPGVREDVTDVVLNIKKMALAMDAEGTKRLTLSKKGPGVVTAKIQIWLSAPWMKVRKFVSNLPLKRAAAMCRLKRTVRKMRLSALFPLTVFTALCAVFLTM